VRALTFRGERTIALETVSDPRIERATDAVVRVELAAICGSDLHVYHARERGLDRGTVMGHEFVGEVVECGPDVAGLAPGDRVLSPFTTSCGGCFYCREGLTARCESGQLFGWVQGGHGLHGAQAEYVRVPLAASTLVPIPEGLSDDDALLAGDVASTGLFCARGAGVHSGGTYVVLGCGPVGLAAVAGALALGAETLFAADTVPGRLAHAERLGARGLDLRTESIVETIRAATDGRGADAVLEAAGTPEATRLALDLVRPGGTVSAVAVHAEERFPFSPVEAYDKNLTYRTGRCPARSLLSDVIPLLSSGRYDLASMISHRLPLERGVEGYDIFDRKADGCMKVVLLPASTR